MSSASAGVLETMFPWLWAKALTRQRSLSGDLLRTLLTTITLVVLVTAGIGFVWMSRNDYAELQRRAEASLADLGKLLSLPLWQLNHGGVEAIVDQYYAWAPVSAIRVTDQNGGVYLERRKADEVGISFISLSEPLYHRTSYLGELTMVFNDATIRETLRETSYLLASLLTLLLIAVTLGTLLSLRRLLARPLRQLSEELQRIAGGRYGEPMPVPVQAELAGIAEEANRMALAIARREKQLADNQSKLTFLNEAILALMRSADARSLIEHTLRLLARASGSERVFFLSYNSLEPTGSGLPSFLCEGDSPREVEGGSLVALRHSERPGSSWYQLPLTAQGVLQRGLFGLELRRSLAAHEKSLLTTLLSLADETLVRQTAIAEGALTSAKLQVAQTVQQSMLPLPNARMGQAEVAWHYQPVEHIGGDWFHIAERPGELYLVLGDVTGHGIGSGLVSTAVGGALHAMDRLLTAPDPASGLPPEEIVATLDHLLHKIAGKSELRMTCVAARIRLAEGTIEVCNAGHTFPLLVKASAGAAPLVKALVKNQQPMLGELLASPHTYTHASYPMARDDVVIVFTDGLSEAQDRQGKLFQRRLIRRLGKLSATLSAGKLKDDLLVHFAEHCVGVPLQDDVCLVVAGMRAELT